MTRSPLIGLFTGEAISLIGVRMSLLALPWMVLVTTGSPTLTGLVAAGEMLPYVLASALGAPLIDRLGARGVSIAADLLSAAIVAMIPFIYQLGFLPLLMAVAVTGLFRGMGDISKRVLLPLTVEAAGMDMTRASALYDGISRLSTLIGAPLGGVLIAAFSPERVIWVNALTFAVCAVIVAVAVRVKPAVALAQHEPYFAALKGGLSYLRRDKLILYVVLMLAATNLFDQAISSVFIPVWAHDIIKSPVALGACGGALALGAVTGNILMTALATKVPRYLTFTVAFLIAGAPRFLIIGFSDSIAVVLAFMFVAGFSLSAVNPILGAFTYERIPEKLIARVFGIATALAFAGIPLGGLLAGASLQVMSFPAALAIGAVLYLLVGLIPVFGYRTWKQLDVRKTPMSAAQQLDVSAA